MPKILEVYMVWGEPNRLNLDISKLKRRAKFWGMFFRWNRVSLTTKFKIRILVSLESFRRTLNGYIGDSIKLYRNLPRQDHLIQSFDWKTLIILDACRYDIFKQNIYDYLNGLLMPVLSPSCETRHWLKTIWVSKPWKNVVYISSNPFANKRTLRTVAKVHEVWRYNWIDNYTATDPSTLSEAFRIEILRLNLSGKSENMRFVLHYMKPHAPYKNFTKILRKHVPEYDAFLANNIGNTAIMLSILYELFEEKDAVDAFLKKLYIENLKWVLEEVSKIIDKLPKPIVITADHGELLGEYNLYFHPKINLPQLRIVPWFIIK